MKHQARVELVGMVNAALPWIHQDESGAAYYELEVRTESAPSEMATAVKPYSHWLIRISESDMRSQKFPALQAYELYRVSGPVVPLHDCLCVLAEKIELVS